MAENLSVKEAFERFYNNLDGMASASLPVGIVIPYLGSGVPSGGWFLCNGGQLSKTAYPELFSVIGYDYGGEGDVFNLPDLPDRRIIKAVSGKSQIVDATLDSQVALNTEVLATTNANLSALAESSEIVAYGGSDSTGYYIRYSNGVQMCWKTGTFGISYSSWGSLYASDTIPSIAFPMPFVAIPSQSISASLEGGDSFVFTKGTASLTAWQRFGIARPSSSSITTIVYYIFAIGKWK